MHHSNHRDIAKFIVIEDSSLLALGAFNAYPKFF
jgi:hypothetical protein